MFLESLNIQRRLMPRTDWPTVLEWRNDPGVAAFMGTRRIISLDEHMRWFDQRFTSNEVSRIYGYYSDDKLLSNTRIDKCDNGQFEISIIVHPKYRQKGLALYCLKDTLIDFSKILAGKQAEIFARIHPKNIKSLRLFKKAGFSHFAINEESFKIMKIVI